MHFLLIILILLCCRLVECKPFPISFSISETKIVSEIPNKDKDFAFIIPGNASTYIYNEESDYYKDYQRSYFAITKCKGGWDCLRHYEILANGCIPYFIDIDRCPANTMHLLPKELIKEAMQLPGVYQGRIDHSKFDIQKYNDLLQKILEHTRKYLTAKSMAQYMLDVLGYQGKGPVLFLANDKATDYLKICILIGLKELLSDQAIDVPRIDCIYTNFDGNSKAMYGKGFSYTRVVNDVPVNRDNIEDRIKNKEFELIIYGYTHHGLPFHDIVTQYYDQDHTAYLCGEDIHTCTFANLHNMFLREHYL